MASEQAYSISSGDGVYISPVVTNHAPDANVNVESSMQDTVTVTGIVDYFTYTVTSDADAAAIANAFDVSGLWADCILSDINYDMTGLQVSMAAGASADFKTVIADAVLKAVDPSGNAINKYLSDELWNAFTNAFSAYLPIANLTGLTGLTPAGADSAPAVPSGSTADPATSTDGSVASSVAISSSTVINGFSVEVRTDQDKAASDLWDTHDAAAPGGVMTALLRQLPKANLNAYLPAGATAAGSTFDHQPLVTDALPLLPGDKLQFIFDIDVNSSNTNAVVPIADADGAQHSGSSAPGTALQGSNKFTMDLGKRRVALELVLPGTGTTLASLRANAAAVVASGITWYSGVSTTAGEPQPGLPPPRFVAQ